MACTTTFIRTDTCKKEGNQGNRYLVGYVGWEAHKLIDRQADRQTERQTDKQIDRQRDRQIDR